MLAHAEVVHPEDQLYVYGGVPPAAAAEREPLQEPGHVSSVFDGVTVSSGGSVIVTVFWFVQLFASVVVTVYVWLQRPVTADVLAPVDQEYE
jgi:hypothetical protein